MAKWTRKSVVQLTIISNRLIQLSSNPKHKTQIQSTTNTTNTTNTTFTKPPHFQPTYHSAIAHLRPLKKQPVPPKKSGPSLTSAAYSYTYYSPHSIVLSRVVIIIL